MNFSLDYDGTYTEDPELFSDIVRRIRARGHKVYVVTMRYPAPHPEAKEVLEALSGAVDGFFFTSRRAKVDYMGEYHPDTPINIWIDDSPWWLLRNSY